MLLMPSPRDNTSHHIIMPFSLSLFPSVAQLSPLLAYCLGRSAHTHAAAAISRVSRQSVRQEWEQQQGRQASQQRGTADPNLQQRSKTEAGAAAESQGAKAERMMRREEG